MEFGFAKVDVTPTEPVRLSGYGNRNQPLEGVDEQLFARAMALRHGSGRVHLLVSVDSIGLPATLSQQIFARLKERHQLARSQLVLCGTHTHTGPHLDLVNMINLFSTPLTETERAATQRYAQALIANIVRACNLAIDDMKPGKMFTTQGTVTFATNRRILKDGLCVGMGPNPHGAVDHSLPILKITDPRGENVRGLVFNYACHCTTFGGDHNRVNGDSAACAAQALETAPPGAVALSTIGCGADANPQRDTGHDLEVAQAQGRQIAQEVNRLEGQAMGEVTSPLQSTYGYAALPIDRPSLKDLKKKLEERSPQVRQHAQNMLATHQRMGRLPDSYPMPIQVWRFGDQLTMIFFGGEVCVDYALRAKREFSQGTVWVTAYANDLFGYVASERMQSEGGYEVDFSMIFYNQPGRWSTGTEEIIFHRLHELADEDGPASPLSVSPLSVFDALKTFTVPAGFTVDAVA
ncbi:MAG: neutral/alkaline non-lysosomal ceramidase N-terminal domain-containing protein, partial [Pirellulales bacterium]